MTGRMVRLGVDLFEVHEYKANTAGVRIRRVFDNNMIQISPSTDQSANFKDLTTEAFLNECTLLSTEESF